MRLPHRAIVAYAARCARRVQPRYPLWLWTSGPSPDSAQMGAIEIAVKAAEDFANGIEHVALSYEEPIENASRAARHASEQSAAFAASMAAHAANAAAYCVRSARAAARYANPAPHETFPAPDTVAIMAAHAAAAAQHAGSPPEAALTDYQRIIQGDFGVFPELGRPVDCSEHGPLGPLWPASPPDWFKAVTGNPASAT